MVRYCIVSADHLNDILTQFTEWREEHKDNTRCIPYANWRDIIKKIKTGGNFSLEVARTKISEQDTLTFKLCHNSAVLYTEQYVIPSETISFADWVCYNWDKIADEAMISEIGKNSLFAELTPEQFNDMFRQIVERSNRIDIRSWAMSWAVTDSQIKKIKVYYNPAKDIAGRILYYNNDTNTIKYNTIITFEHELKESKFLKMNTDTKKWYFDFSSLTRKEENNSTPKNRNITLTLTYEQLNNLNNVWKKALEESKKGLNAVYEKDRQKKFEEKFLNSCWFRCTLFINYDNDTIVINLSDEVHFTLKGTSYDPICTYELHDIIMHHITPDKRHLNIMPWRTGHWAGLPKADDVIYRINSVDWRTVLDNFSTIDLIKNRRNDYIERGKVMSYEATRYTLTYSPSSNIFAVYNSWDNDARDLRNLNYICPDEFIDWAKERHYLECDDKGQWYLTFLSLLKEPEICADKAVFKNDKFITKTIKEIDNINNNMELTCNCNDDCIYNRPANISITTDSLIYDYNTGIDLTDYSYVNTNTAITKTFYDKSAKINNNDYKDEENKNIKMFNFDFGWIKNNDGIRVSPYGLAVKDTNGKWVAYDKNTGDLMDVDIFNFNGDNCFFKMPCAIKDVAVGHVIIHQRKPMVVVEITDGKIWAIDPVAGERKCIVPLKNMFGFNFVVRVMSLFDNFMGQIETASDDQPFGNMLPLMMLGNDGDMNKDMLLAMMIMGGNMDMSNPMMLMLMCGDKTNNNDFLNMMLMNYMMNNQK